MTTTRLTTLIEDRAKDKDVAIIANKAILIEKALEADITTRYITKTKSIKKT